MNWSLVRIPSWLGSTMTLAIPITSTLMAWAFLRDQVSLWQFVGMAVVMFAVSAVVLDQSRTKLT
ncbi:EamA family transporter [Candidatus Poriferisodalis sp.]|uniref:EamA family transporter n=1 Tax=Candidatus Poriferisodalis sp. TaxID=3101277 RepID=UPI003D0DE1C2